MANLLHRFPFLWISNQALTVTWHKVHPWKRRKMPEEMLARMGFASWSSGSGDTWLCLKIPSETSRIYGQFFWTKPKPKHSVCLNFSPSSYLPSTREHVRPCGGKQISLLWPCCLPMAHAHSARVDPPQTSDPSKFWTLGIALYLWLGFFYISAMGEKSKIRTENQQISMPRRHPPSLNSQHIHWKIKGFLHLLITYVPHYHGNS